MTGVATRLLIALAAALALVGGGYWWGHSATDNAWQAKQAKADEKVRAELGAMTASAGRAAVRYLDELIDQRGRYANLDRQYRDLRSRHPLVVPGPVAVASCPPAAPPEAASAAPGAPGDSSPVLTLAAVRMWNGALAGVDSPAGACGPAGAAAGADAACSDDSGLTLDDAWDNHAINARTCAEDRQRYRALINLLQSHQQGE